MQAKQKRILARLAVTMTLALLLSFLTPVFIDRPEYAVAVSKFSKNPTVENGVALALEAQKHRREVLAAHLEIAGILFVIANFAWHFVARAGPALVTKTRSPDDK
jgi:hypothetical protein